MINHLIIGNGPAGTEAASAISKNEPDANITIISASSYLHYSRPRLVHFLANTETPNDLLVHDSAWYEERKITNILNTRIISIDPTAHIVRDQQGNTYNYDKLLIANGSKPMVPPIPGANQAGVFTLRSISDALRIRDYSAHATHAVVIGGGLLGLENAWSLLQMGKSVTVIESAPWLLPRQLDRAGGEHLQQLLESKGLHFIVGKQARLLEGLSDNTSTGAVVLDSEASVKADMVILSMGVRAELDILTNSGIQSNRGILVNDFLTTSVPDIWAAGDVAEHKGICSGLWSTAREMGRIAGQNMSGLPSEFAGNPQSSVLKITGIPVFSMGPVSEPGNQVISASDQTRYCKLILDSTGQPLSAMVIGDKMLMQTAQKVMSGKASPEDFRQQLG